MKYLIFINLLAYLFFVNCLSFKSKLCGEKKDFDECLVDNFDKIAEIQISCTLPYIYHKLIILPNERLILDKQLNLLNCSFTNLYLNNFKGIRIDDVYLNYSFYRAVFYNSDFRFYFDSSQEFKQRFFIRENFESVEFLKDVRYFANTSTAVFKGATISNLKFTDLVNSRIKTNYFTFSKSNLSNQTLNSKIKRLDLEVFNIELNNNIIDEQVFEYLEVFYIAKLPQKIDSKTFKTFKYLNEIHLTLYSFKRFFHQGIKWMKNLNNLIKVNYTSFTHTVMNEKNAFIIIIEPIAFENEIMDSQIYTFPDEDFCLFLDFPHENYVYPNIYTCFYNSCTFNWLNRYRDNFENYIKNIYLKCKYIPNAKCDFEKMIEKCNKINSQNETAIANVTDEMDYYYFYNKNYLMEMYDFVIAIVLTPLVCVMGIFFNILNIIILKNKRFKKDLQNRMYKQMVLNSYINLLICLIYHTRLTIKCIDPIGRYCLVSIVTYKFYRYFFLIMVNYFGNVLKTCSNLIQISISLDRFILSTDTKSKFLLKFIKIDLKIFFILIFIFSSLLNLVKLFEYDYELDYTQLKYPLIFIKYFNFSYFYSYLNILNIFISDFCLIIIQLIIDVSLLKFVRSTWKNKLILLDIKENQKQKINHKIEKNIRLMILMNGFCLLLLHSPEFIISIYMASTDYYLYDLIPVNVRNFDIFTFILNDVADIVYLLGYSINFFFFYNFNIFFRRSLNSFFSMSFKKVKTFYSETSF